MRCHASWSPRSSATGTQWEMRFKQGKPVGRAQEARRRARHRHHGLLPSRSVDLSEDRIRRRRSIRERLEVASYLHRGVKVMFDDETTGSKTDVSARRRRRSTTCRRSSRERGAKPVHEAPFVLQKENGAQGGARAAVDGVHRRAPAQLRQRHSRRARAARTRTGCAPGSARRFATTSRRTTSRRKA